MFQSDDFDDILSVEPMPAVNSARNFKDEDDSRVEMNSSSNVECIFDGFVKKRSIDAYDNKKRKKRKFPGPAGMLPDGNLDRTYNSTEIPQSQNFMLSQNNSSAVFDEGPWNIMMTEMRPLDYASLGQSISFVKFQAENHKLNGQRIPFLVAMVQSVDRTLQDLSVVLRDSTGEIHGTLHRDVWETFNRYIVPHYTVMFLKNISVLTTGSVVKKHYLNITLNCVVMICCDEDSVCYTKNHKYFSKDESDKKFTLEKVKWNSTSVVVLRNKIVDEYISKSVLEKSGAFCDKDVPNEDEALAQTLLSGISTDAFFDDFE